MSPKPITLNKQKHRFCIYIVWGNRWWVFNSAVGPCLAKAVSASGTDPVCGGFTGWEISDLAGDWYTQACFFCVVLAFCDSIKLALPLFVPLRAEQGWGGRPEMGSVKLWGPATWYQQWQGSGCKWGPRTVLLMGLWLVYGRRQRIELHSMQKINGILQNSECLLQFQTKQTQKHRTPQIVINYLCGGVMRRAIFSANFRYKESKSYVVCVSHAPSPL